VYSDLLTFTTAGTAVPPVANCGDSSGIPNTVQQTMLQTMQPGDTIFAGDFKIKTTNIIYNGGFTGSGYTQIPWLFNVKVAVRFTSIQVNTAHQLAVGHIETTYDFKEAGIGDIDEYIDIFTAGYGVGNVVTGTVTADTTFNFTIQWPGGIVVTPMPLPASGGPITITLAPQGGGQAVTYTVNNLPTTLMDKDGNLYQINAQGQVIPLGKKGGEAWISKTEKKLLDNDVAVARFAEHSTKQIYAFDDWKAVYANSSQFNKEYEKIKCVSTTLDGSTGQPGFYYVGAKAIAPGKTDYLKCVVTRATGSTINLDSVQFVTGKGIIYNKTATDSTASSKTFEVAIIGGPEKDAQEVYVLYPRAGIKTLNFGKLLVASYPRKEYKVKLIPVNNVTLNADSINSINTKLNLVYNKLNIYFQTVYESSFNCSLWDVNQDGKLEMSGNRLLSSYNAEMGILKNTYLKSHSVSPSTAYLFLLDSSSRSEILGALPRGKKFGFIIKQNNNNLGQVCAHEVGHGLFSLKHPFDEPGFHMLDLADNLMDYVNGLNLTKHQWDFAHDPALVLGLFDGENDDKSQIVETLPDKFLNPDNATFTFLTYCGQTIIVPKEAKNFIFHFGISSYSTGNKQVTGVLQGFTLNNIIYSAKLETAGVSYNGSDGSIFQNNLSVAGGEKCAIIAMPNEESICIYKLAINGIPKYDPNNKKVFLSETDFTVLPFSNQNYILKDNDLKPIKEQLGKENLDLDWAYTPIVYKTVKGWAEKQELIYISKIAQIRNTYDEYFSDFTSTNSDWYFPDVKTIQVLGGGYAVSTPPTPVGIWGNKLEENNGALKILYQSNKVEYFKTMLTEFKAYVNQEINAKKIFFDTVSNQCERFKVLQKVNASSNTEIAQLSISKQIILLEVLITNLIKEDKHLSRINGDEAAITKVIKNVSINFTNELLSFLSQPKVYIELENTLTDESEKENYYSQYVAAVLKHIQNREVPTINSILESGNCFLYFNKSPNFYSNLAPVDLDNSQNGIEFLYTTKAPFVGPTPGNEYAGVSHIGYYDWILLKLDDDYTINNTIIFKKADYPNGVLLTGLELYWIRKEALNRLWSQFNSFVITGTAMAVSGPGLVLARGWNLIFAIADFQAAAKFFVNTTPQYQQLVANYPTLATYLNAWDEFNEVYFKCRIFQLGAQLVVTKWIAVKAAANNLKNDATISATIKNDLKINEIMDGVTNPNLTNLLKGKLSDAGYNVLQTWKAGKNFSFVDELGTHFSGVNAETALFYDLDKKLGTQEVIETKNVNDWLVIVCRGTPKQNTVYYVLKNDSGDFLVTEIKRAYKPSVNPNVDVAVSEGKIAPDYSKNMAGNPSTQYLCPPNYLPPGKSPVVRIEMTGDRGLDFLNANRKISEEFANTFTTYSPKFTDPNGNIVEYTWHHLDDMTFNAVTEKWECEMQLTLSKVHGGSGCYGMGHTGAPALWRAIKGSGY
jgi:hypothetical protein